MILNFVDEIIDQSHKSHNAPVPYPNVTLVFWIVHCEIWDRCLMEFVKHYSYYWPVVRGIDLSPVDPLRKGPVMRSFGFSLFSTKKLLNKLSNGWWFETLWHWSGVTVIDMICGKHGLLPVWHRKHQHTQYVMKLLFYFQPSSVATLKSVMDK